MKALTIRECAYRALVNTYRGHYMLFDILKQAFDDCEIDWEDDDHRYTTGEMKAVYDAIAPDIIASCGEEADGPVFIGEITIDGE